MNNSPYVRRTLWLILLAVFIKQSVLVFTTPAWLVPDEAAHLQYTRTIFQEGRIPELRGRLIVYDPAMTKYFSTATRRQIGHEDRKQIELERYWQAHPTERSASARYNPAGTYSPIYYAAIGWPLWLIGSQPIETRLLVLRFVSSLLLLVVVVMVWRVVNSLANNRGLAATVALLVGFHPGIGLNFSGINNDAGLIAGGSIILAIIASWWGQRPTSRQLLLTGAAAGLVTLIKPVGASFIIMTAFAALVIVGWRSAAGWKWAFGAGLIGLAIGSSWIIREQVLGYNSFLFDPELWKIQSRLLPDVSFRTILHGDLTYWWPAAFFTYWGEYFAKEKIPTVLPLGYFAAILVILILAIVGWVKTFAFKTLSLPARRIFWLSLSGIIIHEACLWLIHLQTILRYHDFHFLYHGRYRLAVAPLVLLLLVLGIEKLLPEKIAPFIRVLLILLMVGASAYVGWTAAHV